MIPLRTDSRLRATPWMNWAIIAANIAAFVVQHQLDPRYHVSNRFDLSPRDPHVLNFITYGLLHANLAHVGANMLFLYIFGNNVNDKMGHIGYLAFYLAGCVFAGVGYVLTEAYHPVIGASGAVAAVTGAYLCLFPRANVTILFWWFYIGIFEIPSIWFIGFFFAQDLFFNFAGDSGVAHMAHVAGTIFGFVICFGLLFANLLPRDHFDVVALFKQWNRRRQFRDITASGHDFFAYTPRQRVDVRLPAPRDPRQEQIQDVRAQIGDAIGGQNYPRAAELYQQLRTIDPQQVLSRQAQLDVAAQLASQQAYPQAAEAYELFLANYRNFEQVEQVELMLGLIYARYLERYDKAKEYLLRAMARLHGDRELALAKAELQRIEPLLRGGARGAPDTTPV
jgi:membrane associated rhomboid family serine protease